MGQIRTVALAVLVMLGAAGASAQPAGWTHTTEALSKARYDLVATSVGDKALFAGGFPTTRTVDIYDNAIGLWTRTDLSWARQDMSAVSARGKAFFAGGGSLDLIDIYDAATGTWSTERLSVGRNNMAVTAVANVVMFAGGWSGSGSNKRVVDIYDLDLGAWSTATLSGIGGGGQATSVGSKALIHTNCDTLIDIYDATTKAWSTANLVQARDALAAVTVGNKALFAGGWGAGGASAIVDIYDADTDTWSFSSLSQARSKLAGTVVGQFAIFAGGIYDGVGTTLVHSDVVDIYDSETGTWDSATLSQARELLAATSVGNKALFGGGYGNYIAYDTVDVFTIPEPATLALLALGGLVVLRRRAR